MTKKKTALCITAAAGILIAGAAFVNRERLQKYRRDHRIIRIAQDYESLLAVHGAYTEEERTTEPLIRCGDYSVIPLVGDMNPCWYLTKHADS